MSKSYSGQAIEITFNPKRCIHARNCALQQPDVFDPDARPWISPDAAPAEEIAATIRTCPSGALTFRRLDGGLDEQVPKLNRIRVLENGPLAVTGDLDIAGTPETRAVLCRCGASGNMPHCDGSHEKIAFRATGEPSPDMSDTPLDEPNQTLRINPRENGPNVALGPVEVVSGTGHRIARGQKHPLCRCGRSANKPFCDGSHNAFKAD